LSTWFRSFTSTQRTLFILAVTTVFATSFSISVIYLADLLLPAFTARFDNYAFATAIPLAASPLLIYPMLWLLQRVEQAQAALEHMARTDVLTEVANRRGFFEAAEAAFAANSSAALMMVDIDHFKRVNDLHGHAAGDELLKQMAQMIRETVRERGGVVGRLGGEEFAVLIAGADSHAAEGVAERLCRNARMLSFAHESGGIGATLSIGLAMTRPGDTVDAALRAADRAAYEAKRLGRDRWKFAAPEPARPSAPSSQAA
jgi:diguanylate cyclase (GGDEF)-like protein